MLKPSAAVKDESDVGQIANMSENNNNLSKGCKICSLKESKFTHVIHMIIYGGWIYFYCLQKSYVVQDDVRYELYSCPNGVLPFGDLAFWQRKIAYYKGNDELNSDGILFAYDFLMIAFTTNFWMFVINLLIPIYPLDDSKILLNCLLGKCSVRTTARCYCCVNGIVAVI